MPSVDTICQKAMAYDLMKLLDADPGKTYTVPEINELIRKYIESLEA